MGRYARFLDADLMFGLNIIFIVVLLAIIFTYADRTKIIEEDLIKQKEHLCNINHHIRTYIYCNWIKLFHSWTLHLLILNYPNYFISKGYYV